MNNTPRTLNRVLIGILGLLLLATGLLLMLVAAVPAVAAWWQSWSAAAWNSGQQLFASARFPGRQESWLWVVVTILLVLLVGAMVAWLAQQGKGRTGLLVDEDDEDSPVPGIVQIGAGVAEQALKDALADRPDLAGATVTTYDIRRQPALKIRLQPRQGVAPHMLATEVSALVTALDAVLGKRAPVLIHIAAGAKTRFSRADRVR